jgi:hypothetical protein
VPEDWLERGLNIDNVLITGYGWEIADDPDAPTVDDILKANGRSVMDSRAAKVTEAELEDDLEKLLKQRDKLTSFVKRNGANQTAGTEESAYSKAIESLFTGVFRFLNTLSRDPSDINVGAVENKYPEIYKKMRESLDSTRIVGETYALDLEAGKSVEKSVGDEALIAAITRVQLSSRLSANISFTP